ncbi:acyl-CoA dehydrogenase family protein [Paracoccus sp. N5]|uniref:acyl-CoA dehydrogenase family protein n=1 Tax=Paracoccus sp. N5 TaxID=1101189 RepID=UPI00036E5E17|nr:acyl-CoA dehydrogenase family protein [Paracoccus sp. N5]
MEFSYTEDQASIASALEGFAANALLSGYMARDREGGFPQAAWQQMGEMGLFGLRIPQEYGGQGLDCVTAGIAIEAIARGDFNLCYGILNSAFVGDLMSRNASRELCEAWLPRLASGAARISVCLTEPHCGSDAAAIRTRAKRDGDHFVLSGEKASVTLVMAAHAGIVFARTDPEAGARGVSAFLVPFDDPGVTRHPYADMGSKCIQRGSLFLNDVRVPETNLIGTLNGAFGSAMQTFEYTRALIGLMCVGAAAQTLDETIAYTRERTAFGQPVSRNQGVAFPVAEAWSRLQMARWHCLRTLWLRDREQPHNAEAAVCKGVVPDICVDVIRNCLVLHGHYGYTQDLPIEQRLRDVCGQLIADGTPQIQKIIIARHLYGREFV